MSANPNPNWIRTLREQQAKGNAETLFNNEGSPDAELDGDLDLRDMRRQISKIHSATCHSLASLNVPIKLRYMVCVILAAANGKPQFSASQRTLVGLLFKESDSRSYEAKRAEVKRMLDKLDDWQGDKNNPTIFTVRGGGKTKNTDGTWEFHDTHFSGGLLDALAEALLSPRSEIRMREAVNIALASLIKRPSKDSRYQPKAPTPDELQQRERKAAITMALKAAEKELEKAEELRGDPIRYVEALAREMVEAASRKFTETPPQESLTASVSGEITELEAEGGGTFSTLPPPRTKAGFSKRPPKDKEEYRGSKSETQRGDNAPGCASSEAFEAVRVFGEVDEFRVTMLDDKKPKGSPAELYEVLTGGGLRLRLPALLRRNEEQGESLIVRPVGGHLIQMDDCDRATLERLAPFARVAIETSDGSFQSWLALPVGTDRTERDAIRARILRALGGVDRSASGAMRWPGSINQKPGRGGFRVRLINASPGRFVTVEELEGAGLLAALPPPMISHSKPRAGRTPRTWPDYQRCVREALARKDGSPDLSIADKNYCVLALGRGWSESEVEARLCELRDKARRRPGYARSTVAYAARVVSGSVSS